MNDEPHGEPPHQSAPQPADEPQALSAPNGSEAPSPDVGGIFDGPAIGSPVSEDRPVRRRVRVSRRTRRKRRIQRRLGYTLLFLGALLVVGGAWIAVTGLLARSALEDVRADLTTLRRQVTSGDLAGARATAAQIRSHASDAQGLTEGPAWALAADLPGGGAFHTVRTVASQVDYLASDVLPPLVQISEQLDPQHLRASDGTIDLAELTKVAPVLDTAVQRLNATTAAVSRTASDTQIGPVDRARASLLDQLAKLQHTLTSAATAAHVAPTLLGADGVKRYFVAFQNEAEARGTGGLPGAFAIVQADHGKLSFEQFQSDTALGDDGGPVTFDNSFLDPGSDYGSVIQQEFESIYGTNPMYDYRNSNDNPHFPFAAQIWLAMWKKHSGQQLDGAATLDPTALSYLLKVTGPASYGNGQKVTAANVVALTQQTIYNTYGQTNGTDQNERKQLLLEIARSASNKIVDSKVNATALVKAAAHAVSERRLLFYSSDDSIEASITGSKLSGTLPIDNRPYAGLAVLNLGGNKLDYYLHRSMQWSATGCGDSRDVVVTITLTNAAPAGLPPYVVNRADFPPPGVQPGDNRLLVSYYASSGAVLESATLNGQKVSYYPHTLMGHPLFNFDTEMSRGKTQTIVLRLREPGSSRPLTVLRQPGVNPLSVTVDEPRCS